MIVGRRGQYDAALPFGLRFLAQPPAPMNRLITTNLDGLTDPSRHLPPRAAAPGGPSRLLFIHGNILGFRNVAAQLKHFCADRPDVDAVHIDLVAPKSLKILGKSIPGSRGFDFHQDRYRWMWGRIISKWFRGPLDPLRFDAIHFMTQVNAWAMLGLTKRFGERRPACAVNIDSTAAAELRDFGVSPLTRRVMDRAERRMFDAADFVACRNAWAAESLTELIGLPPDRVHLAQNSMAAPTATRDWDQRSADAPVRIAFAGNNWKRKGGDLVLEAHQRSLSDRCELHIFGDRVDRDDSARNVTWHGRVPRNDLIETHLPSMDIFVMASRFDMLPWALLEGAGAGLALVAARTGAIPDVVRDGETGRLFEPGDGAMLERVLVELSSDLSAIERMGRAARQHLIDHFDPAVTYPALLDRLIAAGRRHATAKDD